MRCVASILCPPRICFAYLLRKVMELNQKLHTDMQEITWARLRDSRPGARAVRDSCNLFHAFSCISVHRWVNSSV